MADIQPSNNGPLNNIPPGPVVCHECGSLCENLTALCAHLEYQHKHVLQKWDPHYPYPQVPGNFSTNNPMQGFQPYMVKSEMNYNNGDRLSHYEKPTANCTNYAEPSRNFMNNEQNFLPSDNNKAQNFIKPEVNYKTEREIYSPKYDEPPVQSPHNSNPEFHNGFRINGNRPKNGNEPEEILDLDSQRVHHVYQTPTPRVKGVPPKQRAMVAPPMEDAYDMVSTTTMTPPDANDSSPLEQPYPDQAEENPKAKNWKSNEARRPKTYHCTACNKWFTSSGHLKRHYNTTLHKNAVTQSGQPDPSTLPISVHHHPYKDPNFNFQSNGKQSKAANGRNSNNFSPKPSGPSTPTPDKLPPDCVPILHPPSAPLMSLPPKNEPSMFREPQYSPKAEVPDSSYPSPGHNINESKDPRYVLNNNYSQNSPNLMAGPSETSEGLLPPPPPTSHYQHLMPQTTFPTPPTSIQTQNFLPLTTNYPNFQAPHVSSTQHQGININPTGNQNVLGQHVDERAFIPLLLQASRSKLMSLNNQDANTLIQLQRNISQYVSLDIQEEFVGGLSSPRDLDFSPTGTNPDHSGTSFNTDNNISSTSYANPSFQSSQNSQSEFSSDSGCFSPNYSFNNNNNNNNNVSFDKYVYKELKINPDCVPIKQEISDENIITSTNRISPHELPSPTIDSLPETNSEKLDNSIILRCDDCNKDFNKSCYLKQHNRCFHSGAKPFKCTRCGKRYDDEISREKHMLKHSSEKPHKCEECPKSFHHKTDLRRHMFTHNVIKPHVCPLCSKGFVRKDHMLKHTLIHSRKQQPFDNLILGENIVTSLTAN